jgi:long-chain acyl-CoA synthetase
MILRGGYNIYPRELEEVIMTHPAVSLCAVIGVPDEKLGEEVKAFLVLKGRGSTFGCGEFIDWSREQFAANKYPQICRVSRQPADRRPRARSSSGP